MLARLQQIISLALLAIVIVAWYLFGASAPIVAFFVSAALPLGYAGILAAEFLCSASIGRSDRPAIHWLKWWNAWFAELTMGSHIFCWRQPFRTNAEPDSLSGDNGSRRCGVVLVHGLFCNRAFWTPWMRRLRSDKRCFVAINLEPVFGSIDGYRTQIATAVYKVAAATGMPVLVICHSMGGLAVRRWLVDLCDDSIIHHVVTIATPHHGTWLARFAHSQNAREMQPNSPWLNKLNGVSPPGLNRRFVCWYSDTDNIVFPESSACLSGADNRLVAGVSHVCLAFEPSVMNQTLALLD